MASHRHSVSDYFKLQKVRVHKNYLIMIIIMTLLKEEAWTISRLSSSKTNV